MLTRTIQKIQSTHLISIPAQLCALLGIEKGTVMGIEVENRRIIMTPVTGQDESGISQA